MAQDASAGRRRRPRAAPARPPTPDDLFAGIHDSERRELVEQALKLPQHQRVPLVLYHFEDMPYQEIAQHLRISLPKVKTDILRARAALAKILANVGEAREAITE